MDCFWKFIEKKCAYYVDLLVIFSGYAASVKWQPWFQRTISCPISKFQLLSSVWTFNFQISGWQFKMFQFRYTLQTREKTHIEIRKSLPELQHPFHMLVRRNTGTLVPRRS